MYAPVSDVEEFSLERRQYGYYGYPYGNYNSSWYNWGRWVLLAAIIVGFLVIFFVFSCVSARRRRKLGRQPLTGTGWLVPQHGPVMYNGQLQPQQEWNSNYPPPNYQPPSGGYYSHQRNEYELSSPPSAYQPQRGGDAVYEPPSGPPPAKSHLDIVR